MSQTLATTYEPCFYINHDLQVHIDDYTQAKILADHLSHRVSRHPQDLLSHVQRIHLACRLQDSRIVYAALLDLFIALGEGGQDLRRRMLLIAGKRISLHQRQALIKVLLGKSSPANLPLSALSRLQQPGRISATLVGVGQNSSSKEKEYRLIDEARDLIDFGQLETAKQFLEEAVTHGNEDTAVHEELLALYKHSQNQAAFEAMYAQSTDFSPALSTLWNQLKEHFDAAREGNNRHD